MFCYSKNTQHNSFRMMALMKKKIKQIAMPCKVFIHFVILQPQTPVLHMLLGFYTIDPHKVHHICEVGQKVTFFSKYFLIKIGRAWHKSEDS